MEDIGNRVAVIQEETAVPIWRHVPSQSNPAGLIKRDRTYDTFNVHTGGKDHNGFPRNHPTGLQQRSTLLQTT